LRKKFANLQLSSFENPKKIKSHQTFLEKIKKLSNSISEKLKIFFESPISLTIANYLVARGD
ncbi:hypothetical protein ACEE76_10210, partial [Streptococcus hyovaginalis]